VTKWSLRYGKALKGEKYISSSLARDLAGPIGQRTKDKPPHRDSFGSRIPGDAPDRSAKPVGVIARELKLSVKTSSATGEHPVEDEG